MGALHGRSFGLMIGILFGPSLRSLPMREELPVGWADVDAACVELMIEYTLDRYRMGIDDIETCIDSLAILMCMPRADSPAVQFIGNKNLEEGEASHE